MHNAAATQLLCTFSTLKTFESDIQGIIQVYKVDAGKIYVLQNQEDPDQIFLTYNVDKQSSLNIKRKMTISVHRKRGFNVIYSINALNLIVQQLGVTDPLAQIDWAMYQNSLVIANTDNKSIRTIPTVLLTIFRIGE